MEYNADATGEKYREIARAMGVKGVDDMSEAQYRSRCLACAASVWLFLGKERLSLLALFIFMMHLGIPLARESIEP